MTKLKINKFILQYLANKKILLFCSLNVNIIFLLKLMMMTKLKNIVLLCKKIILIYCQCLLNLEKIGYVYKLTRRKFRIIIAYIKVNECI